MSLDATSAAGILFVIVLLILSACAFAAGFIAERWASR
jgi:hypothetical protein